MRIERDAPISTWFGVGGRADRLARPGSVDELRACVLEEPRLRMLGDGANLLVDDDGVEGLVVSLNSAPMSGWEISTREAGLVRAMAGANLPRLILDCVRAGLGGLEGLGGIPATLGGALVMNAGGSFGQISDSVERVHALDRAGNAVVLERGDIGFSYRHSGLNELIVVSADLRLTPGDAGALRARLKDVMQYKKESQPMGARSAGCAFRNPTITGDVIGPRGEVIARAEGGAGKRVSAGMLIDKAGCKALAVRSASVSERHANFLVVDSSFKPGARARDVIELMALVQQRVLDAFGVRIEPEVVVWRRGE